MVKENGPEILPITTINNEIIAQKRYLTYDEITEHLKERLGK